MKIRHISILAGVTALSVGSLVAFAEPKTNLNYGANNFDSVLLADRGDGGGQGLCLGEGRLIQELELTPEQQTEIQAIKENYHGQMESMKAQMKPIKEEMRALMVGTADQETIRAKHQEAQAMHSNIQNARFEQMLEIREILTPDQREKFAEIMDKKRGQKGVRWQEGQGRMGQRAMGERLQNR